MEIGKYFCKSFMFYFNKMFIHSYFSHNWKCKTGKWEKYVQLLLFMSKSFSIDIFVCFELDSWKFYFMYLFAIVLLATVYASYYYICLWLVHNKNLGYLIDHLTILFDLFVIFICLLSGIKILTFNRWMNFSNGYK